MRIALVNGTLNRLLLAAGLTAVTASAAGAQQAAAPARWQAWLGCWTAAAPGENFGSAQFAPPVVCITPTARPAAVEVTTVADGKVISTETLDASGAAVPVEAKGCTGTKRGQWSSDARRVFLSSELTCDGVKTVSNSILAITPQGEWLDVRGVTADGASNVLVARYHPTAAPSTLPANAAAALSELHASTQLARIGAGAPFGPSAVTEAEWIADSVVTASWVLEQGQRFVLDAKTLVSLANAGLPGNVTDAMIAASSPERFQFARAESQPRRGQLGYDRPTQRVYGQPYDMGGYYDRYGRYVSPYGFGYGYGYGGLGYNSYGGYGYNGGYGYYSAPIIIVTGTPGAAQRQGRMVKGQGYTQSQPSASPPRTTSQPTYSGSSDRSGASSSSGSSSSGSSSSGDGGSGRTAKPRP